MNQSNDGFSDNLIHYTQWKLMYTVGGISGLLDIAGIVTDLVNEMIT